MSYIAIYARVSTADQTTNMSLPDQVASCRQAARSAGYSEHQIVEYVDAGVSGGKGESDRPQFGSLMSDVRAGKIQVVYFLSLDRLSRDTIHTLTALADMRRHGVKIVSLRDPHLESHLVTAINAAMAQEERMRIRDRTLPRKLNKRDKGFWVVGAPPYGYRLNHTTKTLVQCPNEAPILRRIFELARRGEGRTQIARALNNDNVLGAEVQAVDAEGKNRRIRVGHVIDRSGLISALTDRGLRLHEHGGIPSPQWKSSSVAKVLKNTMAFGVKDGIRFAIEPSPILTESEFLEAQTAIAGRRPFAGAHPRAGISARWLLTGIMKCGSCGSNYVHHESRNYHRYCCNNRRSGGGCTNPNISMEIADSTALHILRSALWREFPTSEKFRDHLLAQTRSQVWNLQARLTELTAAASRAAKERGRLEDLWTAGISQGLSAAALAGTRTQLMEATTKYHRASDECARASAQMTELTAGLAPKESEINQVSERMRSALMLVSEDGKPMIDLRALLSLLVSRASVSKSGAFALKLRDREGAMPEVVHLLARTELEYQRKLRFAALA